MSRWVRPVRLFSASVSDLPQISLCELSGFLAWLGKGRNEIRADEKAQSLGLWLPGMILDGVLEQYIDGRWLTGPYALHIVKRVLPESGALDILSRLSRAAIRSGFSCPAWKMGPLLRHISLFEQRTLAGKPAEANEIVSSIEKTTREKFSLEKEWEVRLAGGYWTYRKRKAAGRKSFDLYISPHPSALMATVAPIMEIIISTGPTVIKIGAGMLGMERPDKIIARYDQFKSLEKAASAISDICRGYPAHGASFTAAMESRGIVSWSPAVSPLPGGWRQWIAGNIASSILIARVMHAEESEDYCIARLEAAGVNTLEWLPRHLMMLRGLSGQNRSSGNPARFPS